MMARRPWLRGRVPLAHLGRPQSLQGQLLRLGRGAGQQGYQPLVHLILVLGVTVDQRIQQNLHFLLGLFRFRFGQKLCDGAYTCTKGGNVGSNRDFAAPGSIT